MAVLSFIDIMKKTTVTNYVIDILKEGAGSGKAKAVFLSDLHNSVWNNDREYLPRLIKQLSPDIILCGGDIITAQPSQSTDYALWFMREMLKIAPVYYGLGNHEFRSRLYPETYGTMYEDYMPPLIKEGVHLLDNEKADISVNGINMTVYGLEIPRKNYMRFRKEPFTAEMMRLLIGSPDRKRAAVLLAHNPLYYRTYLDWGADLTLCGHYHGGIIGLGKTRGMITPDLNFFSENCRGRFEKGASSLIISAGMGEHTIPFRINNPRELITLDFRVNL